MKRTLIVLIVALFTGCNTVESPEEIREKLSELKDKQLNIRHEIKDLEEKLNRVQESDISDGAIPVLAKKIERVPFSHFIFVNGRVEVLEEAHISPETNGQIKTIHINKGQFVNRGDVLVSLNTSMIENNVAEVRSSLELSKKTYQKQKDLWEQNIGSEMQFLEAKNAKESLEHRLKSLEAQLDMSIIKAPFSGIVDDIFQKEGELTSPGKPVLYIANLNKLKVTADVSESLLPKINEGDTVAVTFPTYKGINILAPIHRIGNLIDQNTRTISIELRFNNIDNQIKPNQIAKMKIRDFYADSAIVVPSIVIKQDIYGDFLFVVEEDDNNLDIANKQYVESGLSYDDSTMITDGLDQGQRIIVSGFNQVGSGSLIHIK
ncbi:MAG: efflux RND transporter periplasmic adaptor subunit [Bacteroidales bacterium]